MSVTQTVSLPDSYVATAGKYKQTSLETIKYVLDYTAWLASGETLSSYGTTVDVATVTPLLVTSVAIDAGNLSLHFSVSGGMDGQYYNVHVLVYTSTGQTREDVIGVSVRNVPQAVITPAVVVVNLNALVASAALSAVSAGNAASSVADAVPTRLITATGSVTTIDCSLGRAVVLTLNANTTLAITNWPVNNVFARISLHVVNSAAFSLSFPAGVKWVVNPGVVVPATGGIDLYSLTSTNNGVTVLGHVVGQNYR